MVLGPENSYTYKITPGISDAMMALDMMVKFGFPTSLVKYAKKVVDKLNKKKYI